MTNAAPEFLLYSKVERRKNQGEWNFALQTADGAAYLEARDTEPDAYGERLELLAVLRGLEALDQPSVVTVYTTSRYVRQGYEYGLDEWRRNGWNWERYGELTPVKNRDLWQRLDRARRVHHVELRRWRVDEAHDVETAPAPTTAAAGEPRVLLKRRSNSGHGLKGPHFQPSPLWSRRQNASPARQETTPARSPKPLEPSPPESQTLLGAAANGLRWILAEALGQPKAVIERLLPTTHATR